MKKLLWFILCFVALPAAALDGAQILQKVDRNLEPETYDAFRKLIDIQPDGTKKEYVFYTMKKGRDKVVALFLPGSNFEIGADLVILAVGFSHPEHSGLLSELNVELDKRGNVKTNDNYMTSVEKVFSAGDIRRGQSFVVWAISEGRRCAHYIDKYLMGESNLASI